MACKAGINDSSVVNSVYTFGNDPVVIYTSPTDNATGVLPCDGTPCRAKIILQFDRSMNTGLLAPTLTTGIYNGSSYINAPVNTTHIWKTTRYSNDTLTLHLSWVWFPENSKIQWSLDKTNLKDTGDNGLTTNVQQTFTTTGAKQSFSLADTGQTTCYNDSGAQACGNVSWPGQDADYADTPNARSFTGPTAHTTYTSDYTTKDNITSLVWKSCTEGISGSTCSTGSAPQMTWYNALNQCATLNTSNSGVGYAGRTDWRLPTMRELEMLPNLGVYNPAIDTARFPATVSGTYWSSSTYPSAIISAWGVGFSAGNSGSAGKTTLYSVRCVSSSSAGSVQALTDNDDGTVTDTTTNLVWQKCSYGQDNDAVCSNSAGTRTWQQALQYCNALALNGRAWRLPSVVELLSIADKTKSSPALDSTSFPATVSGTYWSSTPYTSDVNKAWIVYSGTGFSASTAKMNNNPVRCVADE
ncbi:MAG TPA: DUF1566 domain-containing protein [Turneriella sp.]|nr:DUF1566 domain-containing protein [Turneriella sp.]